MRDLDQTDLEILELLVEDARRPYNEIADVVDLSPPTVSDRVERLQELGVINRFTVDIERSTLSNGVSVLVDLHAKPGRVDDVKQAVHDIAGVEHVFRTADAHVIFQAHIQSDQVEPLISDIADDALNGYDVSLLADTDWMPHPGGVEFAFECDECGNTVTNEGETVRIDGSLYQFCCSSCVAKFEDQYEQLYESA